MCIYYRLSRCQDCQDITHDERFNGSLMNRIMEALGADKTVFSPEELSNIVDYMARLSLMGRRRGLLRHIEDACLTWRYDIFESKEAGLYLPRLVRGE